MKDATQLDWVIVISDKTDKIETRIVRNCDEETASAAAEKLTLEYRNSGCSWSLHKIL